MRKVVYVSVVAGATWLALAGFAGAHHIVVSPPGRDAPHEKQWVGGPPSMTLPDSAQGGGLHQSPVGPMPAAHSAGPDDQRGLVQACRATREHGNGTVAFHAPPALLFPDAPPDTDCEHGE